MSANEMLNDDYGKLILRIVVGLLILFHGVDKVINGVDFIQGLVGPFAYLVYLGEVVAPLFMIAGAYTRIAAVIVATNMVVAVLLAHVDELLTLAGSGGYGLELQAMYLFSAVAVIFLGAGRYSLSGSDGSWN